MAKDTAENYHPVPSIRRLHAKDPMGLKNADNQPGGKGPVIRTEVEKHDDGSAHAIAHHKGGQVSVHQHPNEAAAHDHARNLMSGGDSMQSDGQVDNADAEACPTCGGDIVDGKCQVCGYTAPSDKNANLNDQDQDDAA